MPTAELNKVAARMLLEILVRFISHSALSCSYYFCFSVPCALSDVTVSTSSVSIVFHTELENRKNKTIICVKESGAVYFPQ